jgi:hypothetical protein
MTFSFTYGQPFDLIIDLNVGAQLSGGDAISLATNVSGNASVDFGNTLSLNSITLEDSSGNAVSNYQITSESGTQYGADGVETPEPFSAALFVTGLATTLVVARRRASARNTSLRSSLSRA